MFRESSYHTIDEKGRFAIPKRFRLVLQAAGFDGIMVSRLDGCLMAYTVEEWGEDRKPYPEPGGKKRQYAPVQTGVYR